MCIMDIVPTCTSGSSTSTISLSPPPYYHIIKSHNKNNRGASTQRVPPPAFSGGLSKNMDLHSQYEPFPQLGHRSHSALFGSSSSVWRLPTHSSFSSFSASDDSPNPLLAEALSRSSPAPSTTTQQFSSPSERDHQVPEEQISSKTEFCSATASDDEDDEDGDDQEQDDDSHTPSAQFHFRSYQYRHIFSNSTPAPASTSHPAHFLDFSFTNTMTGPDRTNYTTTASTSHRANPLAAPNQPPRPPNAWILYRSDKLKNIPLPPPGVSKRPQAEVSKMISQMWRLESADVRGHYERLSEIKKAEHQAMYPGYRFQPMKKEDKDRIRAEKLAEKEKEREARKANRKTRPLPPGSTVASTPQVLPLFTTQARPLPSSSVPTPAAIGAHAQTPSNGGSISQPSSTAPPASSSSSSSTSPGNLPTPPGDNDTSAPPSLHLPPQPLPLLHQPSQSSTSSSSSSASSSSTTVPPLMAPQPTVPQRLPSPSAWEEPSSSSLQQRPDIPFSFDNIPTWFDSSLFLPDPPSDLDGYITVPLPSQQPLGWSPDDLGPLSDMHFSFFDSPSQSASQHPTLSIQTSNLPSNIPNSTSTQVQAQSSPPPPPLTATSTSTAPTTVSPDQLQLHAVVEATSDPNIFALDFDFLNNELFDGTREIQVSMASNMLLSTFGDFINNTIHGNVTGNGNDDFANLLNWDPSNFSAGTGNNNMNGGNNEMNFQFPSYSTGDVDYSLPPELDLGIDVDMSGGMDSSLNSSGVVLLPSASDMSMAGMGLELSGSNSFSSMSMSMNTTPSATSANTSRTSLHPTPPPPWPSTSADATSRDEQGEREEEGSKNTRPNFTEQQQTATATATTTTTTPYVPPAGAMHASTRRVAADWRHIRVMTPDPELGLCIASSKT